jgi:hypothetical protein
MQGTSKGMVRFPPASESDMLIEKRMAQPPTLTSKIFFPPKSCYTHNTSFDPQHSMSFSGCGILDCYHRFICTKMGDQKTFQTAQEDSTNQRDHRGNTRLSGQPCADNSCLSFQR